LSWACERFPSNFRIVPSDFRNWIEGPNQIASFENSDR
jgi:hypothetical protein